MKEYITYLTFIIIGMCLYRLWHYMTYLERVNDLLTDTLKAKNMLDKEEQYNDQD